MKLGLETYHAKRDFKRTPEPKGKIAKRNLHRFVVQEHHASKLHFDFRLEMDGVLKSWSIPKGPSLDPRDKRFAVPTEDHPVEYLRFQGHIPKGNYGAGEHMIWDTGTYELLVGDDPLAQLEAGKLNFQLHGEKLKGAFNLLRMREGQWLLVKSRDEFAQADWKLKLLLDVANWNESRPKIARTDMGKREALKEVKKYSTKTKSDDVKTLSASRAFKTDELIGDIRIKVGSEIIALSNLDKVYWPEDGYTKGDLLKYYYDVSKYILPYLKDRPLIMKRYPNGIEGKFFHQHDVNETPDYVRTTSLEVEEGLVLDLDPGEGIDYGTICDLALTVKDVLGRIGLKGYPKTSGSRGLHVYVPLKPVHSYEEVAAFAERVATLVANERPEIATVERSLKKRKKGQIYVDHMQNARGKSVVAPYSVRPRNGATVSAPLEWREVERKQITPQDFSIKNMGARLAKKGDLFKPVLKCKQNLSVTIEKADNLFKESKTRRAKSSGSV